jgi:hypothetical protein
MTHRAQARTTLPLPHPVSEVLDCLVAKRLERLQMCSTTIQGQERMAHLFSWGLERAPNCWVAKLLE